jgi:hypothetical protein
MKGNKIICVSFLAVLFAFPDVSVGEVDWQNEYNQLKAKIEKEYNQPRRNGAVSKVVQDYVDWLGIKARDRQKATEFAGKDQLASNPYWHNRFLDLATAAQDSGDSTVWTGGSVLMELLKEKSRMRS